VPPGPFVSLVIATASLHEVPSSVRAGFSFVGEESPHALAAPRTARPRRVVHRKVMF